MVFVLQYVIRLMTRLKHCERRFLTRTFNSYV